MLETVLALEPKNPKIWTDERNRLLVEFQATLSRSLLAERINERTGSNFTRNAVIGRLKRVGLCEPAQLGQVKLVKSSANHAYRGSLGPIVQKINKEAKQPKLTPVPFVCQPVEVEPLHLALIDLESDQCRQPYGTGPYTFCGHAKRPGSSYCWAHSAVNEVPAQPISKVKPFYREHRAA